MDSRKEEELENWLKEQNLIEFSEHPGSHSCEQFVLSISPLIIVRVPDKLTFSSKGQAIGDAYLMRGNGIVNECFNLLEILEKSMGVSFYLARRNWLSQ
jgi:hypothetical protein